MDALELALRCSSLLKRSMSAQPQPGDSSSTPSRRAAGGQDGPGGQQYLSPGALSFQSYSGSSNGHDSSDGGTEVLVHGDRVCLPPPVLSARQAAEVLSKVDADQLAAMMRENEVAKQYMDAG
jgi:hypothetical protein